MYYDDINFITCCGDHINHCLNTSLQKEAIEISRLDDF